MKKIAGIVIDDWKLKIFRRHLDDAGCIYTEHLGITEGTITLRIQYEWVKELLVVVEAAIKECNNAKKTTPQN